MESLEFLMVTTHYPPFSMGGDATMVDYLSRELVSKGHEVHVLHCPSVVKALRGTDAPRTSVLSEPGPVLHSFAMGLGRAGVVANLSTGFEGKAERVLSDLVEKIRPDVVHWHNTKGFLPRPRSFPRAVTLYTAHDYFLVCPRSNLTRPDRSFCQQPHLCAMCTMRWRKPPQLWRLGSRRVIRPSREVRVICPTEFMAKRLRADGLQVHSVLDNFVPDLAGTRSSQDVRKDYIAFVGMVEPHKGPSTLLEAFSRSREKQGFDLFIVGEGSLRESLAKRVHELSLTDRVRVTGYVPRDEMIQIMVGSTSIVVPSEWPENASLVVRESLSLGVPLITSDQGALPESIGEDSGSSVFRAGDADELAERLQSLWASRYEQGNRRRRARESYEKRYSPDIHMARYLEIIDEERAEKAAVRNS